MGNLSWGEIFIIVLVIAILFGSKKIPEFMRSLRQGIDEFKKPSQPEQPPQPPPPPPKATGTQEPTNKN